MSVTELRIGCLAFECDMGSSDFLSSNEVQAKPAK